MKKILPNFLIVGTPKSGSTTLYEMLTKHPEIYISDPKEPHFFSEGRYLVDYDWDWYHSLFEGVTNEKAIGEATVEYTVKYHRKWADPSLIHSKIPDAKILYLVRHPLDRSISQFVNTKMIGHPADMGSFENAVKNHPMLVEACKYWENIKPYLDLYGERNVKILFFEDMKNDTTSFFKDVFHFLGVDESFQISELDKSNPTIQRPMDSWVSSFVRRKIAIKRLKTVLPERLITRIGNLLKNEYKKPRWDDELVAFVKKELSQDNEKLLEYCGKSKGFWNL